MTAGTSERVDSRHLVVRAAAVEFAAHGYAAATMRELAARCGISTGGVLHYFGSKRDLLLAVLGEGTRAVHHVVASALADETDSRRRVVTMVAAHLRALHGELRPYLAVVMHEFERLDGSERDLLVAERDRYEGLWQRELDRAADAGRLPADPLLRMFLLGAVNHTYWWFDGSAGLDVDHLAARLVSLAGGADQLIPRGARR